jgi:hypothetical protein
MERSCATNKVCHSQFFKARSRRCCSPNKTQSRSGTFAIASQSHLFHSYTSCVRRCDSNPPSGRARFHLHRRTSALSAISRIVRRQTHINGILIEPHLASKFAYGPSSLRLRWIKHLLSEALGTRYALLRLPRNNPSKLETQRKRTRSKIYFRAKRGQADPDVIDPVRITSEPLAISFRTTPGRCPPHQFSSITTMSNSLGRGRLIFAREVFRLLVLSKISHSRKQRVRSRSNNNRRSCRHQHPKRCRASRPRSSRPSFSLSCSTCSVSRSYHLTRSAFTTLADSRFLHLDAQPLHSRSPSFPA